MTPFLQLVSQLPYVPALTKLTAYEYWQIPRQIVVAYEEAGAWEPALTFHDRCVKNNYHKRDARYRVTADPSCPMISDTGSSH